jgi:6-phosphogluconate dehydrogenase (decarboxylating)
MELGLIGLGKMGFNMATRLREDNNFSDRMVAVMRNAFGGHAVKKSG